MWYHWTFEGDMIYIDIRGIFYSICWDVYTLQSPYCLEIESGENENSSFDDTRKNDYFENGKLKYKEKARDEFIVFWTLTLYSNLIFMLRCNLEIINLSCMNLVHVI